MTLPECYRRLLCSKKLWAFPKYTFWAQQISNSTNRLHNKNHSCWLPHHRQELTDHHQPGLSSNDMVVLPAACIRQHDSMGWRLCESGRCRLLPESVEKRSKLPLSPTPVQSNTPSAYRTWISSVIKMQGSKKVVVKLTKVVPWRGLIAVEHVTQKRTTHNPTSQQSIRLSAIPLFLKSQPSRNLNLLPFSYFWNSYFAMIRLKIFFAAFFCNTKINLFSMQQNSIQLYLNNILVNVWLWLGRCYNLILCEIYSSNFYGVSKFSI